MTTVVVAPPAAVAPASATTSAARSAPTKDLFMLSPSQRWPYAWTLLWSVPDGDFPPVHQLGWIGKRLGGAHRDSMGAPCGGGCVENVVERGGGTCPELRELDPVSAEELGPLEHPACRLLAVAQRLASVDRLERDLRV